MAHSVQSRGAQIMSCGMCAGSLVVGSGYITLDNKIFFVCYASNKRAKLGALISKIKLIFLLSRHVCDITTCPNFL